MQSEARSAELDRRNESMQSTEQELLTKQEVVKKSEGGLQHHAIVYIHLCTNTRVHTALCLIVSAHVHEAS